MQQPDATNETVQELINVLTAQRNEALNASAMAFAQMSVKDKKIAQLEAELAALKTTTSRKGGGELPETEERRRHS